MNPQSTSKIFGIDLGTTYSCIAYVNEYGKAVVVPGENESITLPSVVRFEGNQRIVGMEAKNSAVLFPRQVVEMVKQHMGEPGWCFPYNCIDYTAEEISSYILRKLVNDAESVLRQPINEVVITCPAYFGVAQREATVHAGKLAGLSVKEIINEPTAAAITYGLHNEKDQVVLVYDLGGGTFDISIIRMKAGEITVIATGGSDNLGGRNWDLAILTYLAEQWQTQTGLADDPTSSLETRQDLLNKAEVAKIALTSRMTTNIIVTHAGKSLSIPLSREHFASLTAPLLDKTLQCTHETMKNARMRGCDTYDQILLVGGSSKMRQVVERLKEEFSLPIRIFEPDIAVAKGAATYGYKLSIDEKIQWKLDPTGAKSSSVAVTTEALKRAQTEVAREAGLPEDTVQKFGDLVISNVTSHSFGVIIIDNETKNETISNIIMINDGLPVTEMKTYYTLIANQEAVEMKIVENTRFEYLVPDLSLGQEIGKAILHLPPRLPLHSPIEVLFTLQRDGRLYANALEPKSGKQVEVDIQTTRILTPEQVQAAQKRTSKLNIS